MIAQLEVQASASVAQVSFRHTFRSEWMKLRSVRSTHIALALGLLLCLGLTALVSLAVGSTSGKWSAEDRSAFEPVTFSLVGVVAGGIVYSVLGVLTVSGEYASGMIGQTFTATPRRQRVLMAKALLVTVVVLVAGAISMLAMFVVGQAILGAHDMPTARLGDGGTWRALLGIALLGPYFPLVGLALGFLLRSAAAAITTVLGLIWLPEVLGGLLPLWWRENVLRLLPGPAIDSIAIGHLTSAPTHSHPIAGTAIAALWLAVFVGAAALSIARRDI